MRRSDTCHPPPSFAILIVSRTGLCLDYLSVPISFHCSFSTLMAKPTQATAAQCSCSRHNFTRKSLLFQPLGWLGNIVLPHTDWISIPFFPRGTTFFPRGFKSHRFEPPIRLSVLGRTYGTFLYFERSYTTSILTLKLLFLF